MAIYDFDMPELGGAKIKIHSNNDSDYDIIFSRIFAEEAVVTIDMEGVNLGADGITTLIQLYAPTQDTVHLIDIESDPTFLQNNGYLSRILESTDITKVFHCVSSDSAALITHNNILLQNVFDVQAADVILQEYEGDIYFSFRRHMNNLLEQYQCRTHTLKDLTVEWRKDRRYWQKRPLTRDMIMYAAADVTLLMPLYKILYRRLVDKSIYHIFEHHTESQLYRCVDDKNIHKIRYTKRVWNVHLKKVITETGNKVSFNNLSYDTKYWIRQINLSSKNPTKIYYWKELPDYSLINTPSHFLKLVVECNWLILREVEKDIEETEFPHKYLRRLCQLKVLYTHRDLSKKATEIWKKAQAKANSRDWLKIGEVLGSVEEKYPYQPGVVPQFDETEENFLNKLSLGRDEGFVMFQRSYAKAPLIVTAFIRQKMLKSLRDIQEHFANGKDIRMGMPRMSYLIEEASACYDDEIRNFAIRLFNTYDISRKPLKNNYCIRT